MITTGPTATARTDSSIFNMLRLHYSLIFLCIHLIWIPKCWTLECGWSSEYSDLNANCVCGTGGSLRLTVQCTSVELPRLVSALKTLPPLDLLSILNGTLKSLRDESFNGLDVRSIQLSGIALDNVSSGAFHGLERVLTSLELSQNEITAVPTVALRRLMQLKELDLSGNRITEVNDDAFGGLSLTTLKLADNHLQISDGAFRGLESSLHNLNLKGTGQTEFPNALKRLSTLSFLDMSQNKLSQLNPGNFLELNQLTALTLERNAISAVDEMAFTGLNATLSSLSLLNNKIEEFPSKAIALLKQLRVLDMGFNRIRSVPDNAFVGNPLLSLLALDGNPLSTISETAFFHLNSTLRGLSIGGSTLVCDCRLRWILRWVKTYDLQVTSRERSPQFCGRPLQHRRRSLPQMSPNELKCEDENFGTTTQRPTTTPSPSTQTTQPPEPTTERSSQVLLTGVRDQRAPRTSLGQLRILDVMRQGMEVTVKWENMGDILRARNAPPVHIMYRVFGEPHFHLGASINPAMGYARITVPDEKPVVVCVVESAQAATLAPESVPHNQCYEVQSDKVSDSQLNKVIIGSSAAVCGMIIIAVVIFVCCARKSKRDAMPRPTIKSEHEWENASLYSTRSIPRARAYHGSINPSFLHEHRTPDDVQSFRSLPPSRIARGPVLNNKDLHNSHIALSQLSGQHSFLGAYGETPHNGWSNSHHWDNGDIYAESRRAPSRLSYAKDSNFG